MAVKPACQTFFPLLSPYCDQELAPADRVHLERHLAVCPDCTARAADLRAESGLIRVGMEMLADEADFTGFAQKVMAQLTPHKPPLMERWRTSLSEMFTYHRGMMISSMVTAAVAVAVAVPVAMNASKSAPAGYAAQRISVSTVSTDADAHVAPVVMQTDTGDSIIWVVDHSHVGSGDAQTDDDEIGVDSGAQPGNNNPPPKDETKGGTL